VREAAQKLPKKAIEPRGVIMRLKVAGAKAATVPPDIRMTTTFRFKKHLI
jgi:hypothetical protein